jgi:hypothetical protein
LIVRVFFRIFLLAFGLQTLSIAATYAGDNSVILTITGEVSAPNRGGYDPDTDKFLGFFEIEFDRAKTFSLIELQALAAVTVKADFPKGRLVHSFTGPLLADVLAAAGATGKEVTVQALDGYAVATPMADMIANGAVVAYARDGKMFGIGDFGPTQIVFPRAQRDDLADMSDDNWIWSIFHIHVE